MTPAPRVQSVIWRNAGVRRINFRFRSVRRLGLLRYTYSFDVLSPHHSDIGCTAFERKSRGSLWDLGGLNPLELMRYK